MVARGKKVEPVNTFAAVLTRWFERKLPLWEPKNAIRLEARFKADVLPVIGDKDVGTITPRDVLQIVRAIEGRGSIQMARRMRGAMGEVFRFAVGEGIAERDPTRDIDAALAPRPKVERRRALPPERMGAFLAALDAYRGEPIVTLAARFQILTWARPIEATGALWCEFEDLDGGSPLWRIPAKRMKARREHVVPLSRQAVALLSEARVFSSGAYVFERGANAPISRDSLRHRAVALQFSENPTAHGFRSTGSTWANERGYNRDAIELALAHVDGSIRGVYNRAPYLPERRELLQAWADYLDAEQAKQEGQFNDLL